MADPENKSDELKNFHILVGADYFSYFIIGIERVDGINLFLTHNDQFDVEEWWRLDRVGIAPSEQYTVLEVEAMRKVSQSVVKKPEGYQVSLPFGLDARPDTSYQNAVAQLESLQIEFKKDREYFDQYQGVINKYLEAGFISEVKKPKIEGYYMPHFGIKKDCRTTPLRIVFNASAKSKGHKSLNECLLPGPNLVELAYHLLIRFRLNENAMLADISKAFHCVLLDPRDAKYTRFLWREVAGRALTFAFRVVVFGIMVCRFSLSHVPSKQNPADVLSRGATTQQLLNNPLWQNGPEFQRTTGEPIP
ncbi:uncharacterized protein [Palaemon carinicauda]|uniref:uncharacterized protein n=1 Tax=Palaemon carinicauda TaxID=392227 RepID=UPI0035B68B47